MTTKTTGFEFKKFLNDDRFWSTFYVEDEELIVDGELWIRESDAIPDTADVIIKGGCVYESMQDFEKFFKKWRKENKKVFFVVEIDKDRADAIKIVIVDAGGKIL